MKLPDQKTATPRLRMSRLPFLGLGILSLLAGLWGGLIRLPLNLPVPADHANWITFHGPLMICGFLGTVIGLERAIGLQAAWTYAAPLLTGAGALIFILGFLGPGGPALFALGSAAFLAVTFRVVQLQRALFTVTMSLGAAAWLTGNILWLAGQPVNRVVLWWAAFLVLTILGERLDLSRFQRQVRWAPPLLIASLAVFLGGIILSVFAQTAGERATGFGILALSLWLGRFDIARRTVRQTGLPRFMAICLLAGYVWLGVAGLLLLRFAPLAFGPGYAAALHSLFLGFVFSMIFGHAPVIFPAVLNLPVAFRNRFYLHAGLLHFSLLLRVLADLSGWGEGRQLGGLLNAAAILLFLANTVTSLNRRSGRGPTCLP